MQNDPERFRGTFSFSGIVDRWDQVVVQSLAAFVTGRDCLGKTSQFRKLVRLDFDHFGEIFKVTASGGPPST
jgi:hypothetical protein